MKGTRGKGKKGKKGKERRKAKARETTVKRRRDDCYSAGECGYCGKCGHKKAQCTMLKRDHGGKLTAAAGQAAATVNQVQSSPPDEDSFWISAYESIEWTECTNPGRSWRRRTRLPDGLCVSHSSGADHGQHALRCTRTRDRSSWHENCVHEARTRRLKRGCRIQRQKREITDPSDGEVGQTRLQVRSWTDCVQDVERESQRDAGHCEKYSLGGRRSLHDV